MDKTFEQLAIDNITIDRIERQIQEASSVLKYSLYLKPIEIKTAKKDFSGLLIENANEEVYKNFKPFTNDNTYNIFGCRKDTIKRIYQTLIHAIHSGSMFLNNMLFFQHITG